MGQKKRSERRFIVNQPAELSFPGCPGEVWKARIRDISRRGMQFGVDHPLPEIGEVTIRWKDRALTGVVRYSGQQCDEYRLGVEILAPWDSLVGDVLAEQADELQASQEALRQTNEELKAALALARESSEAKSRFLASVSHELRTPLNGIIGFTQLLHDGGVGSVSDEQKDCLSDVLNCSRHLLSLINHVLDLARIEAGKMTFHYEIVALEDLLSTAIESLRTMAAAKQIAIHLHVDSRIATVEADSSRLRQVVLNYLSNALKFTPSRGAIFVQACAEGSDCYRIEVQDTGIGILEADLPRLFTEFGQLGAAEKAKEGSGLGLAITKRIVETQGGRVGVQSTYGQGSTFYAVLPLAAHD